MGTPAKKFVVCLKNTGYEASLEPRKIYQTLADGDAAKHQQVRVIDESGEDYLYPQSFFAPIDLPPPIRKAVLLPSNPAIERSASQRRCRVPSSRRLLGGR